jgi:hypothetical protein
MHHRLLLAAAALLTLAACSESPIAPRSSLKPGVRSSDYDPADGCKSGYHVATRSDGTLDCVPD